MEFCKQENCTFVVINYEFFFKTPAEDAESAESAEENDEMIEEYFVKYKG